MKYKKFEISSPASQCRQNVDQPTAESYPGYETLLLAAPHGNHWPHEMPTLSGIENASGEVDDKYASIRARRFSKEIITAQRPVTHLE